MSRSLEGLRAWVSSTERGGAHSHRPGVRVVVGGKGGVGTSTLAALMALGLAGRGIRTLLVEADPGGLPLLFGFQGEQAGVHDLSSPGVRVADILLHPAPGLDLLPAGRWGDPYSEDATERALLLRRAGDIYERYDRVVVDGGNQAVSALTACEAGVERVLLVVRPERIAAAGAYAMLKALRIRFPRMPVGLLANGVDPGRPDPWVASVGEAAARFLGEEPEVLARIPLDPGLTEPVDPVSPLSALPAGGAREALMSAEELLTLRAGTS